MFSKNFLIIILIVLAIAGAILSLSGWFPGLIISIIAGFTLLFWFRVELFKWQKQKAEYYFKKSKTQGYLYLIVLIGLILAGFIYETFFR